jgi:hypothetical protein
MSDRKKLIKAMQGIEIYEPKPDDSAFSYENVSTNNYSPPAYIVAFIFFYIFNFKSYGRMDKVLWHTFLKYKNQVFMIRDFKFGSWSLAAKENIPEAKELVPEILGKIKCASRYADRMLKRELKRKIINGDFFIKNQYYKLQGSYDFYLNETNEALQQIINSNHTDVPVTHEIPNIADRLNEDFRLREILAYRALPLMISFFSLLDFLLEAFFAFEQHKMNLIDFRNLSWRERFKKVFSLKKDSRISKIYDKILNVKDRFRDPIVHGLSSEISLLVSTGFSGLIPVSYEYLTDTVHYGYEQMEQHDIEKMINNFERFLFIISRLKPYCFYILFLKFGFAIPIKKDDMIEIKKKMKNYETFKNYLERLSMYETMMINRDF